MGNIFSLNNGKKLVITIVGDPAVGKTCLMFTNTKKKFPDEFHSGMHKAEEKMKITLDDTDYHITLRDTPGEFKFYNVRLPSYINTDCILLCYSIDNLASYENIINVWIPELNKYCPNVPIILVGTKGDLRDTPDAVVPRKAGDQMRSKTPEICKYVECSSLEMKNLNQVLTEAVKSVSDKETKTKTVLKTGKN